MKINRAELLKYAAHGVRERLHEMQKELNELARLFPDIVKHQDGTVPSVMPVELKPTANGQVRGPYKKTTKRNLGASSYWAKMTPAERSAEVARRRAVTLKKKKKA